MIADGASITTIRLFIKQIQHRMPNVPIVIGLWGASANSALLAEIRAEGLKATLHQSLSALLSYAKTLLPPPTPLSGEHQWTSAPP